MQPTKPKQIRVYLKDTEVDMLNELVERSGLKETAALSLLCVAALKAAKEVDYRLSWGMKLAVTNDDGPPKFRLNEPGKRK